MWFHVQHRCTYTHVRNRRQRLCLLFLSLAMICFCFSLLRPEATNNTLVNSILNDGIER